MQQAKAELRTRMRALRNSIPAEARAVRSEKIVEHLAASAPFEDATAVGLFWPMRAVEARPWRIHSSRHPAR
jgi:5-formyltetrahydrofolate cyclo-ligase